MVGIPLSTLISSTAVETAVEKLVALFMVIYQVRCNFEHGQKSPSSNRDQDHCRVACRFVAALVDHTA